VASSASVAVSLLLVAVLWARRRRRRRRTHRECGESDGDDAEKHVGISPSRTDDLWVSDDDDGRDLECGCGDSNAKRESEDAVLPSGGDGGLRAVDGFEASKNVSSDSCFYGDDPEDDLETKHYPLSSSDSLNDSHVEHLACMPSAAAMGGIDRSNPRSMEKYMQRESVTARFRELHARANEDGPTTGNDNCIDSSRWVSSCPNDDNAQSSVHPTEESRFHVVSPSCTSVRYQSPLISNNDADDIHNQITMPSDPSGHDTITSCNNNSINANITVITDDDDDDDDSLNYTEITMDGIPEYPRLPKDFGRCGNNIKESDHWISPSEGALGNFFPFVSAERGSSSNQSTKDIMVCYGDGDGDDADDSGRDAFQPWKEQYLRKEGADGNRRDITNGKANPSHDGIEHRSEYDPDSDWDVDDAEVDGRESEDDDVFELQQPSCHLGHGAFH